MPHRLAVVSSHPIQHFCPQYASWARLPEIELKVFFAARIGLERYFDPGFGQEIAWAGLDLGFDHEFLPGAASKTSSQGIDCPQVSEALATFDPDTVVVYGYAQPLQRRAASWAKAAGKSVLMISDAELRMRRSPIKLAAKRLLVPRYLAPVDAVLTVGDTNEAYYRHYRIGDERMVRTSFPIDVAKFDAALLDKAGHRAAVRNRHGLPPDAPVLLSVGKLIERKRPIDLVDLANRGEGRFTVILAGSGEQMEALRSRANIKGAGGVIFLGFTQPEALVEYYCAADLYLHPSEQDPHPLSVSEAIYCGVPAVVSDRIGSYGPNDDLQPGISGYVHPCGDVAALHGIVTRVLGDRDELARLGVEARAIAVRHQARAHGEALLAALRVLDMSGSRR